MEGDHRSVKEGPLLQPRDGVVQEVGVDRTEGHPERLRDVVHETPASSFRTELESVEDADGYVPVKSRTG